MNFSIVFKASFFFSICFLIPALVRAQPNRLVAEQSPNGTNYWVYTPDGYSGNGTPWAMLVCLHGGSGIVDNNDMNVIVGNVQGDSTHYTPPRLIYKGKWDHSRPFVVIAPHLKRDLSIALNSQEWTPSLVDEVIQDAISEYNIDPDKIYMTGISLGAAGTWNYTAAYPDKIAAIVPISGKTPLAEACTFKDIPIWVFHGSNDDQVFPNWSEDIVNGIKGCIGKTYSPKLNLLHTMAHEGWNMVYDGSHKYDIYNWMARFIKGNNSNHVPFVTLGVDRSIVLRTGPIYINSEYFDSDGSGTISNLTWSKVSGPAIALDDVNTSSLKLPTPVEGTFVFRLIVTDAGGLSSQDDVTIQILSANGTPAITALDLTSGNGSTVYSTMSDDYVANMSALGVNAFNVRATSSGTTTRVRFSINGDQSTRNHFTNSGPYYVRATNKQWVVTTGTYQICATPYNGATEGTSLCHKVIFTDEPVGVIKYYSVSGSNISNLSSWKTSRDETGTSPSNFTDVNQWFYVQNSVTLSNPLTISETSSRLTVESGAQLEATAALTANLYVLDGATMKINTASTISQPLYVGATSTYIYEDAVTMIPPFTNAAPVQYGNLILTSAGSNNVKSLTNAAGTNTYVRGDFTVNSNVKLQRGVSSSDIIIRGNTYLNGPSENVNCFSIRFNGYGSQNLNLPGGVFSFRNFFVESYLGGGAIVKVVSPTPATVRVATGSIGVRVDTKGVLVLNGHTLSVEGGTINGSGQTGQINTDNSSLIFNMPGNSSTITLRPLPGANYLKSLEVISTGTGSGLSIEDDLYITESIKISGGTINTNGNLTLVSTPTSTAYVSPVTGSPTINGNVNIERSVPAGQVYRYLTFPVTGGTVAELQQHIPVNGDFDENSGSTDPSLFYYNEASTGWIPFPKDPETDASNFVIGKGYSTEIFDAVNPEHITISGTLHNGDFPFTPLLTPNTIPANNKGWTLLGNPYAAPVNWDSPTPGATTWDGSGISSTVYIRSNDEPQKILINDGQVGTFDGNIASGQSFWVRATVPGATLIVKEAAKVEETNVQLYRTQQTDAIYLHFNLSHNNEDDDAFVKFNASGKIGFDKHRDAVKMKNDFFNLSLLSSDSVGTAIKNLCDTLCSQEITLAVQPKAPGTYTLNVEGPAFDELISGLAIADKFKNKVTTWKEGQAFTFEVTNDPATSHPKRFTLLIDNNHSPRPAISFSDGALFSSVTSNIQWLLNGVEIPGATNPQLVPAEEGEYSVATTYKGCTKTSAGYTFRITDANNPLTSEIRLYPNPTNDNLTLTGIHAASSSVEYNITSLTGASVQSGLIEFPDGNGEGTIRLQSVAQGFYILNVKNGHHRYQLKFSVR